MEQKDINIYEILKDEEYGTELYTPICGKVWHSGMANDKDSAKAIWTEDEDGREHFFDKNGKVSKEGEVLLFPSKEMRDWSKFFKKGDVLVHRDGDIHVIFEGFEDNRYTRFKSKHYLWKECFEDYSKEQSGMVTFTFRKVSDDEAKTYINTIEKFLGGKLNRETLEIEKPQPEFKEGNVLFVKCQGDSDFATREKNRTYYQEHREQILRATKEWRKRNREKYRAYQKEYWSKHYRNYGTKNRVADRAMRERKKPDVEKALSMFKNPQQAAHLAWLLENKKNNRS